MVRSVFRSTAGIGFPSVSSVLTCESGGGDHVVMEDFRGVSRGRRAAVIVRLGSRMDPREGSEGLAGGSEGQGPADGPGVVAEASERVSSGPGRGARVPGEGV